MSSIDQEASTRSILAGISDPEIEGYRKGIKFLVLSATDGSERDKMGDRATEAMAEIEERGGEYVDSHWSGASYSAGQIWSLMIVYREPEAGR